MKKYIKSAIAFLIISVMVCMSLFTAFAASEATVNGQEANVGDTVTYTMYLGDVLYPIAGVQMYIYYDSDHLELDTESVKYEVISGVVHNLKKKNEIIVTASEGVYGFDFTEKAQLVTMTFNVKKQGNTEISYYISELYDIYEFGKNNYITRFTLTYDLAVNGEKVMEEEPPIINTNTDKKGAFVNREDGKGEDNGKPTEATHASYSVNGEVDTNVGVINDGDDGNGAGDGNSPGGANGNGTENNNIGTFVTVIGVLIIIAAIIVVIITKKKDTAKTETEN